MSICATIFPLQNILEEMEKGTCWLLYYVQSGAVARISGYCSTRDLFFLFSFIRLHQQAISLTNKPIAIFYLFLNLKIMRSK